MESEIKDKVEKKCSSCVFGTLDVDQEPCASCDEEEPFSQWSFNPNYIMDRINETSPQHRLKYSIEILQNMFEFYKLGNPYKHDYDSFNLHEYLNSVSTIPSLSLDDLLAPIYFDFNCRPLHQDFNEIVKELDKFKKKVIKTIIKLKYKTNISILYGEIRDSSGKDITVKALNVMRKALIAGKSETLDLPNEITAAKIKGGPNYNSKKAIDDIYEHRKYARIFVERVLIGTFPYDENNEWKLPRYKRVINK
ncbi:MAG: hypothetical protein JJE30_11345 [Desulfuromonadales bacterium]|nr:hypothetical protein [Desulfuromonadales bacterium]